MTGAGTVLTKNANLVDLCVNKGQTYLDTIEGQEMTDEIDAELNDWQIKAKKALEIVNARRSPITQIMARMSKAFTSLEAKIDPAKPESVYSKIQARRNAFAKKKADEVKAKEQQILKKQNHDKEIIDLKSKIEAQIREAYQNKLLEFKSFYSDKLNNASLETFDKVTKTVNELIVNYPYEKFYLLPISVIPVYVDKAELAEIVMDCRVKLYDELSVNFRENMEDHKRILLDQLPSKKKELETIAKAGAEKKAELELQAKQRQLDEQKRLQDEADNAKKKDSQNIELQKQIATSNTLFDAAAQLSDAKGSNTGQVRQGYKISVSSPAGWGAVFLFWFDKEGQKMKPEDMGKKSLDQMKTFCEKYAHKHNEKIDHESVTYEDEYKAVATSK